MHLQAETVIFSRFKDSENCAFHWCCKAVAPKSKKKKVISDSDTQVYMSRLMGKPTICICENKDADQLRGNREADQRLCFRFSDSTIPLLLKSEISSF